MQETQKKENMLRNFVKQMGQYQPVSKQKEWEKIDSEDLYRLLRSCSRHLKSVANKLIEQMVKKEWTITAAAHKGGKDENSPLHLSVRVKNQVAHHLNCKEGELGGLYIYEITQKPINYNV